jgi:Alpha/beta hydrolase family
MGDGALVELRAAAVFSSRSGYEAVLLPAALVENTTSGLGAANPRACTTRQQSDKAELVHGAPADHTRWRPLLPYLEPYVTVHALDRRGRGASGDAPEYRLEREFEDVAAVVDAVAASGQPVDVYGHSHGGMVAFGAAALTPNVRSCSTRAGRSRTQLFTPVRPTHGANEQTVGRG